MNDSAPTINQDLSFTEKVSIFSADYLRCCHYMLKVEPSRYTYTKRFYGKLISTADLLEDLLDFHGAKNNRSWYFYRELTAAIRHFARAAFSQKHIFNRIPFYLLGELQEFVDEGEATHNFLVQTLRGLAPVILEEARHLGIPIPEDTFTPEDFPRVSTDFILEADIDDAGTNQRKESVVRVANSFLNIVSSFEDLGIYDRLEIEDIFKIVPAMVNEVEIRRFEMVVHNLQSEFDSYVLYGGFRSGDRKLKRVRGFISIVLHLLEITGRLLHFYERHLFGIGLKDSYEKGRQRMTRVINPNQLLDRAINFGLFYVSNFLSRGQGLAQVLLSENVERDSIRVGIPEKLGFHSRPSLMVAKIVQHYGGQVEMLVGEDRFDASSVLDLQWAGGKIKKEEVHEVVFVGDQRALRDIAILASVNYGENTMGKGVALPRELDYLR